jgi:hypothetical protein
MFFFNACISHRPTLKVTNNAQKQEVDIVFKSMKANELDFNTLRAKFSLTIIKNDKKNKLNGQIRIQKDSLIWITLSPALGIEAFRIFLSNDSVKFMNRINKTYFVGDIKYVKDFIDTKIDLDVIQALLLGNDLTFYDKTGFRLGKAKDHYELISPTRRKLRKYYRSEADKDYVFNQRIYLKSNTFKITKMKIRETERAAAKMSVEYDDFRYVDAQLFPYHSLFQLNDGKKDYFIKIDYQKVSINKPLSYPFKISKKYKAISLYEK